MTLVRSLCLSRIPVFIVSLALFAGIRAQAADTLPWPTEAERSAALVRLIDKARKDGSVPAIVGLDVPFVAELDLPDAEAVTRQRAALKAAQDRFEADLTARGQKVKRHFKYIPFVAV